MSKLVKKGKKGLYQPKRAGLSFNTDIKIAINKNTMATNTAVTLPEIEGIQPKRRSVESPSNPAITGCQMQSQDGQPYW